MIDIISQNIPETLIAAGIALIAFEVAVVGFATFMLFFIGLSLITSGALIWLGWVPDTLVGIIGSNAVLSAAYAALLWKPMKKLQNQTDNGQVKSDFDGLRFFVEQAVDKRGLSEHKHSGITWKLKSEQTIEAGTEVEVVKVEVGCFWVKAV